MRRFTTVLLALVFVAAAVGIAQAADKFAYIDLSRVFSEYKKTKTYDKALSDREKKYTDERDKRVNEIKQFEDKMNLLSEKNKEAKKQELEKKVKDFQEYDRLQQTDLRKEQDEKMKDILKDIEDAVQAYSKKEGYTMVFNDRVLVFQDKRLDITDEVMKILDKNK
ncbi:MAG: OmpH family outer membrane protein [Candidatus Omnitrophica bacterium]|nr:OmpH family outer membrane protein [Candidatus Omnitrophota bacterium]MBL7151409.1 OmpH family outer membrane protein [Candidatus Omnitrophota bacterium]MBL7210395.1 OmpH family outer membrane protein [Candidatus Omnitrophota bacterium]